MKNTTNEQNKQVLLVIDNTSMLQFLNILLHEKYTIVCMPNAIDALRWLEEGNYPSLIISDLKMPVMDNRSLIKNLKISGFYRDTPIIVLSSILQSKQCLRGWETEIDGYFTKPFNPLQLTHKIDRLMSVNNQKNAA